MKKTIKSAAVAIALILGLSLVGCSIQQVTRDDATQAISNLLGALGDGDYEAAVGYMHPDADSSKEKLESFDQNLSSMGIVIADGVEVVSVTGFSQSMYSTEYNGSAYSLNFTANIGEKLCKAEATVVRNANGFGVYSINIAAD